MLPLRDDIPSRRYPVVTLIIVALNVVVFLGWWFILQFFNGTLSLLAAPNAVGGIAWWAHIGGFVFGALLCSVAKVKRFYRRRYEDDEMPW